ncbi:response regulator [Hutsoniella sourekii]
MTYQVLLVEDDKMVQAINEDYVNRTQTFHVAQVAASYDEAKEALATNSYDLILIDDDLGSNQLPGSALIKEIRAANLATHIIMLTAQDDQATIQEGLNYGVHDYILKPFSYQRLKSSLDQLASKMSLLEGNNRLTQSELDQLYLTKSGTLSANQNQYADLIEGPLEKGITPATLELILEAIDIAPEIFTIADLTKMTEISHVTVRKYIHFLTQKKFLKTHQEYGNTGRPTIYYLKNKE